jgi:hypothetical protein
MNPVFEEVAVDKSLRHHCVSEDLGSVACAKTVVASYRPRSQREHFSEKRQYVHGTGSANRLAFPRVIHPGHQDQIACVPAPVSSAVQSHHRSLSWAVPQEGDAVMILDHGTKLGPTRSWSRWAPEVWGRFATQPFSEAPARWGISTLP